MAEISDARYRAGEGEPLVLIHGFTATWRCWQPVLADLVPHFDVFAPTLHGHDGGPPEPADRTGSVSEAGDHLEALLDEQGIGRAHLAGNSMGGALAFELAKRGRALSVVGISPGGCWEPGDTAEERRILRFFQRTQRITRASESQLERVMARPGARRIALRDVMTRGDHVPAAHAVALARSSIRTTALEAVYDVMRRGDAPVTGLDTIDCPVLIAWGSKDRVLPMAKHSPRPRREITGAQFRVMPGLGHTPMWDDPDLIAGTIRDFALTHSSVAAQAA